MLPKGAGETPPEEPRPGKTTPEAPDQKKGLPKDNDPSHAKSNNDNC